MTSSLYGETAPMSRFQWERLHRGRLAWRYAMHLWQRGRWGLVYLLLTLWGFEALAQLRHTLMNSIPPEAMWFYTRFMGMPDFELALGTPSRPERWLLEAGWALQARFPTGWMYVQQAMPVVRVLCLLSPVFKVISWACGVRRLTWEEKTLRWYHEDMEAKNWASPERKALDKEVHRFHKQSRANKKNAKKGRSALVPISMESKRPGSPSDSFECIKISEPPNEGDSPIWSFPASTSPSAFGKKKPVSEESADRRL